MSSKTEILMRLVIVIPRAEKIHEFWRVNYLPYRRTSRGITISYHTHHCKLLSMNYSALKFAISGKGGINVSYSITKI